MEGAIAFDTLSYANKLKKAGVPEKQAEVQAVAIAEIVNEKMATKRDIKELETALRRDIKEMDMAAHVFGCPGQLAKRRIGKNQTEVALPDLVEQSSAHFTEFIVETTTEDGCVGIYS